jgi:antitoxin ParD1/3/4
MDTQDKTKQKAELKLLALRRLIQEGENSPIVEDWSTDDFINRMKKKYNLCDS